MRMRRQVIHLLGLLLLIAATSQGLMRLENSSYRKQPLAGLCFKSDPDLTGLIVDFDNHQYQVTFWGCGGSRFYDKGSYKVDGQFVTFYSDEQPTSRLGLLSTTSPGLELSLDNYHLRCSHPGQPSTRAGSPSHR